MEQNDLNYSGQYLDDKYFKIKIATGGDIYNAAGNAVAGEMFLVTGAQPALYAAKSTSAFNEGIVDHEIYKVKDLNDTVKIKNAALMNFPGSANASNRYSLSFDGGVDDYLDISNASYLLNGASTFSISLWYKSRGGDGAVIGGGTLGPSDAFFIRRISDTQLSFQIQPSYFLANVSNPDNQWHHLVATSTGDMESLYLNGDLIASANLQAMSSTVANNLSIGNAGYVPAYPFDGLIDEVAIFRSALSASDITAIYNNGVPAELASYSPAGWWRMGDDNNGAGSAITDLGSGGNDGTINGATFSTDIPEIKKSSVYSLELDGSTSASLASNISFSGPFTISAWIKPNQTGSGLFFGQYTGSSIEVRYSDDAFSFYVGSDYANTTASYPNNSWHHVMVVRDSSDAITFYVNGASDTNTSLTKSGTLTLAGLISSTYGYIGLSDEYAVWDSDQSSNIAEIYNGGIPANLDSLAPIGWWRMGDDDSGSGTTITDQGSGANHATIAGNATYSTQTPE